MGDPAKIDQTVEGIGNPRGNCLQAALATVCRLPLEDVVDVTAPEIDPELWHVALFDWGAANGFHINSQRDQPYQEYYVAIGPTVRKNGLHAVVFRDGLLYHDPHSSRVGLARVRYYITISPQPNAGER